MPDGWPREPLTMVYYLLAGVLVSEGGQSNELDALHDIVSHYHEVTYFDDVDVIERIYFAFVRNYKVIKQTLSLEAYNEFSSIYKAISKHYFALKINNHE